MNMHPDHRSTEIAAQDMLAALQQAHVVLSALIKPDMRQSPGDIYWHAAAAEALVRAAIENATRSSP